MINRRISTNTERGNAMVYILIALALFGFLTVTMSRQSGQSDSRNLNRENIDLYVNNLIEYSAGAQQVIDLMLNIGGADITDLDFTLPTEAGFDTPPHIFKVFHPQGGGLNYIAAPDEAIQNDAASVWAFQNNINVEWTPLDSVGNPINDIILSAYFIDREICARLNEKMRGDATIPATASPHDEYFLNTGTTDFDTTECADCDGIPALCVENDTGDNYTFYNLIATQ